MYVVIMCIPVIDLFFVYTTGLKDYLAKLDSRYEEKVKKDGTNMARKQRIMGAPLSTAPPANAPQWTLDPQWVQQSRLMKRNDILIVIPL